VAGHQGDHREHDGRKKAEDGDGLEDVKDRDHPGLDALVVGSGVSVADGEGQRQEISDAHTHN